MTSRDPILKPYTRAVSVRVYRMLPGHTFDVTAPVHEASFDVTLTREIGDREPDAATFATAAAQRTVYRAVNESWFGLDFYVVVTIGEIEHHRSVTLSIGLTSAMIQPGAVAP